jgi:hypothetical protein
MLQLISQFVCGLTGNHEYIQKNRGGVWHTECLNCLHTTKGVTETKAKAVHA